MKKSFILLTIVLLSAALPAAAADGGRAARLDMMTPANYDALGFPSEGMIWAYHGGKYSYIDENGRTVISSEALQAACSGKEVADVRDFREGLAAVYTESHVTYIDKLGNPVFSADWGFSFSEGIALGQLNGDWVLFEPAGGFSPISPDTLMDWDCGLTFREGLLPFWITGGGRCGYVDTDFNIAIPLEFEDTRPFHGGFAPVKEGGKWGFIDTRGSMVIAPQYDDFAVYGADYRYQVFYDGLAAVKKGGKWGYIDQNGITAVPFIWDDAGQFSEGYAAVGAGGKYGYINKDGHLTIPLQYDDANSFTGGAALVGGGDVYRLIGTDGRSLSPVTWRFESTLVSPDTQTAYFKRNGKWGLLMLNGQALCSADTWAHIHITQGMEKGFIPPELQNSYTQPVTRGEFVTLAVNWLQYTTGKTVHELVNEYALFPERTFSDTGDPVILAAGKLDITAGIGGGKFGPEGIFNRQDAAVMLLKVHTILNQAGRNFNLTSPPDFGWMDILDASSYARDAINFAGIYEVMSGDGHNFNPHETFSRQHSITVFNKMG